MTKIDAQHLRQEPGGRLPFARKEYLRRLANVKRRMAERRLEVLLVTAPANMNYLTGYDGWSFYTPQAVLVALEEDEPIWIGREIDVACAELTVFMGSDRIVGYPDDYVDSPDRHGMDFIGAEVGARGLGSKPIGLESDGYFFSAAARDRLTRALPNGRFSDASRLVNWLRMIKAAPEIECMRQAATVAGLAMRTAFAAVRVGRRQCDAAAAIASAQIAGTAAFGGDVPPGIVMGCGETARAPHLKWSDAPFEADKAVTIELGGCRHRYHAGLARTLFLGRPPQDLSDLAAVVEEGLEAALAVVRPGTTCEAVESAWRSVIARAGHRKSSRIGYSIGIGYPPSWIEQTASLRPGDRTVLAPNMTFHMILGMWQDPVSYVASETIRVTEAGCEVLTDLPRGLHAQG